VQLVALPTEQNLWELLDKSNPRTTRNGSDVRREAEERKASLAGDEKLL